MFALSRIQERRSPQCSHGSTILIKIGELTTSETDRGDKSYADSQPDAEVEDICEEDEGERRSMV